MKFFINDYIYIIPEIYLFVSIIVLLILGIGYEKYIISLGIPLVIVIGRLGLLGLVFTMFLYWNQLDIQGFFFNYKIMKNDYVYFFIMLVVMGTSILLLLTIDFFKNTNVLYYEFFILQLLGVLGVLLLIIVNDFLMLYLAIELQSLCFYILVGFKQNSDVSMEASLKYFILGAFSSGILLFGISLLYNYVGTLNFLDLTYIYYNFDGIYISLGELVSFILIIVGLLFKIGAVPFHMWLLDVYEGSMLMVMAFFSVIPKLSVFCVLIRLFYEILGQINLIWLEIFWWSGILSIIVGVVGGLQQLSLKRLIAYSTISHTGFMLLGFVAMNREGLLGILFYIFMYYIIMLGFFSVLFVLRYQNNNLLILSVNGMLGMYKTHNILGIFITIILFCLMGMPPFIGFIGKVYIIIGIFKGKMYFFGLVCILLSVLSVVYYLRLIKNIFFIRGFYVHFLKKIPLVTSYVISYLILLIIGFIVYSVPLMYLLENIILNSYL